jgi:hypothetical protein
MEKTSREVISMALPSALLKWIREAPDKAMDLGGDVSEKGDRLRSSSLDDEERIFRSLSV